MWVDKGCMLGGTIAGRRKMSVVTYSTQWGWKLLAERWSSHWTGGCELGRPAAHVCSSAQCPFLPSAAQCQSFWALIFQHSRYYPKGNIEQFNSFQADFRKTQACSFFLLSCTSFLKKRARHSPMARLKGTDFMKSSTYIQKQPSSGYQQ